MKLDNLLKLKLQLLQNKSQQISDKNISKFNSHNEFIIAFKKKYPMFFNIIEIKGIPYKQFLSGFFNCILKGKPEPFYIKTLKNDKYAIFDINSSNYNYVTLLPWNKLNIIKCEDKYRSIQDKNDKLIRINKEQFMQSLILLFPDFIRKNPNILLDLNKKLKEIPEKTISINHLYKYLIYCGDKLAKDNYKLSKRKSVYILSKYKIYQFIKIFTYEQLINILVSNNI